MNEVRPNIQQEPNSYQTKVENKQYNSSANVDKKTMSDIDELDYPFNGDDNPFQQNGR